MNPLVLDVLYAGGFLAASPYFLYKMATTGKYRAGLTQRLGLVDRRSGAECIWVHGVSVGEVLAARGIVAALERVLPGDPIAVSTTTNTGYAVALENYPGRPVFYFPLDFSWAVAGAFRRVRPRLVLLMEMEVWPNFLARARAGGVPVVVANGRITERAFRGFSRFGSFARSLLAGVELYLVQNDAYAERLAALGVGEGQIRVTGSVKFDTVATGLDPARRAASRREMGVADGEVLLIGGSTHAGEEEALLAAYRSLRESHGGLRLLIVPRHRTRFDAVRRLIGQKGFAAFSRSSLASGVAAGGNEVLLGDTMGELEALYEAADVAFVGGSLIPHGGQNILEGAAKGKPVIFGPSMENVPTASALLRDVGAATQVTGSTGLTAVIEKYLDPREAARAGQAGRQAVIAGQGATARTAEAIEELLKSSE